MKQKNLIRGVIGVIATMIMIIGLTITTYAADDVTRTVNNTVEAQALIQELNAKGITYNLTIKCATNDIMNYLKGELEKIPLATIYRPVQLVLTNSSNNNCNNNNSNNNNNNNNNNCNNNNSNNNNNNNNNSNNNITNNNCNVNNNTQINTSENTCNKTQTSTTVTENKEVTTQEQRDQSPKTGDMSNIIILMVIALSSAIVMASVLTIRRKRI